MIVDPEIGGTGGGKPDPWGHPGSQNRHVCQISPIFPVFLDFRPQNAFSAVFSCFQLLKLVPWTRIYSPPQVLAGDSMPVSDRRSDLMSGTEFVAKPHHRSLTVYQCLTVGQTLCLTLRLWRSHIIRRLQCASRRLATTPYACQCLTESQWICGVATSSVCL